MVNNEVKIAEKIVADIDGRANGQITKILFNLKQNGAFEDKVAELMKSVVNLGEDLEKEGYADWVVEMSDTLKKDWEVLYFRHIAKLKREYEEAVAGALEIVKEDLSRLQRVMKREAK